jgi:hypothetical protein
MKSEIAIALAGAALLSCASAASASLLSSTPPKPGDSLSLSNAQRQTAWHDLSRAAASKAPTDFKATTSSAIPSTLRVRAIPAKTAGDVPALQPYDYAKIQGKLLIVNPHDMMIAAVIAG